MFSCFCHISTFRLDLNVSMLCCRDSLYRLKLRELQRLEKAVWLAPPDKVQLCQDKGQTELDCHNYVKVLLSNGKRLFTCGTNAFTPQCSWREVSPSSRFLKV